MHTEGIPQPNNERDEADWSDTLPASESVGTPTNPSRRGFLKKAGAIVAGVAGASALGVVARLDGENIISETIERNEAEQALQEVRRRLRALYGIEVDFSPMSSGEISENIDGKPLTFLREKLKACEAIESALMKYPPVFYKKRAIISRIRISNDFEWRGEAEVTGLATKSGDIYLEYQEHRNRTLSAEIGNILANTEERDRNINSLLEYNFHHELEHLVDDNVDESDWLADARMLTTSAEENSAYAYLLYQDELSTLARNSLISQRDVQKYESSNIGFAVPYGRTNSEEDRATIMQCLYLSPKYINRRIKTDVALAQKVAFMKKEYFNMSRGVMDDTYWDVVAQNIENPSAVAKYVRAHSQELFAMSDEELRAHASKEGIELSNEDIKTWREEIAMGVENIDK